MTPLLVPSKNNIWGTSAEIPHWWQVTTQTRVELPIGHAFNWKFLYARNWVILFNTTPNEFMMGHLYWYITKLPQSNHLTCSCHCILWVSDKAMFSRKANGLKKKNVIRLILWTSRWSTKIKSWQTILLKRLQKCLMKQTQCKNQTEDRKLRTVTAVSYEKMVRKVISFGLISVLDDKMF